MIGATSDTVARSRSAARRVTTGSASMPAPSRPSSSDTGTRVASSSAATAGDRVATATARSW